MAISVRGDFDLARHSVIASATTGAAHNNMPPQPVMMRFSSQAETSRKATPKRFLTVSIHAPARGSNAPAEAPTSSNGVPMPSAIASMAMAPRSMLPPLAMNASAPMSTGATQADTMSADSAPMTPTPMNVPARCLLLASESFDWMKLGISMVKAPNIEDASTTNSSANGTRNIG